MLIHNYIMLMEKILDFKLADSIFTANCMKVAGFILLSENADLEKLNERMKKHWIVKVMIKA